MLAALAAFLLVIFRADTSSLIPLYAIGVFLSFTLSQVGMVVRWRRIGRLAPGETQETSHGTHLAHDRHWILKLLLSGLGGLLTATVMVIFAITKFSQGAWIVVLLIPTLVLIFLGIHRHYRRVAAQLSLENLNIHPHRSPVRTLVLVDDVHAGTLRLVNFAKSLRHRWQAIHVAVDPEKAERIRTLWRKRIGEGNLLLLESPYRSISAPLREYLIQLQKENPGIFIHLLVGQLAMPSYWEQVLHRNTNLLIDLVLRDLDRIAVTSVPYQIDQAEQYAARLQKELDDAENV